MHSKTFLIRQITQFNSVYIMLQVRHKPRILGVENEFPVERGAKLMNWTAVDDIFDLLSLATFRLFGRTLEPTMSHLM